MKRGRSDVALQAGAYLLATVLVALAALAAWSLETSLPLSVAALVFLTGVLLAAVVGGLGPSLLASALSFLAYNYFFVEPRFTLAVAKPQDIVSLAVFLVVATLTSNLMSRVRRQAETAHRREARTAALYQFTREVARAHGIDDLLPIMAQQFNEIFQVPVVLLMPDADRLAPRAAHPPDTALPETEHEGAAWAWAHAGAPGAAEDLDASGEWLHVSFATARGEAAVLSLHISDGTAELNDEQLRLLDALAKQAALAIERCRIDVVLEEKAKTEQVIEASEDAIIVLDSDGRVAHVNDVACEIL